MSERINRVTTRSGDSGKTQLATGEVVAKSSPRIAAMGAVDELNCALGVLMSHPMPADVGSLIRRIQHDLFEVGGSLALPGYERVDSAWIQELENDSERFNQELPALREFILPGGSPAASACHMARAICRRAEQQCWVLHQHEPLPEVLLVYLNRLSDLLFILARVVIRQDGGEEIYWTSRAVLK